MNILQGKLGNGNQNDGPTQVRKNSIFKIIFFKIIFIKAYIY